MALRAVGQSRMRRSTAFERVLAMHPNVAEALYNRGVALADLRRFETGGGSL